MVMANCTIECHGKVDQDHAQIANLLNLHF
jgi:hypothetical protein